MPPRPRIFVPELLVDHFEELEFLWDQRTAAVLSDEYNAAELAELEGRFLAHLAGLLVGREAAVELVAPYLGDSEPSIAFSAAFAMLRLQLGDSVEQVLAAFRQGEGVRPGLREALCHAADDRILDTLEGWLEADGDQSAGLSDDAGLVAAIAEVLAFNDRLRPARRAAQTVVEDPDPDVRQTAWRVVALVGG